jgi:two-component system chemotaxis response regulator CheB
MIKPIRVLLVDDSAFLRSVLARRLEAADAGIQVVGSAVDGVDALAQIGKLAPDVVILDVEMPRMDGLTVLERLMKECPTPVVMLSAHTQRGARITVQSLLRGAVDFVPKPAGKANIGAVVKDLAAKVRVAAGSSLPYSRSVSRIRRAGRKDLSVPSRFQKGDSVIVIGASTGGPRALRQILSELPAELPAALVVVQHMPTGFTNSLAQRLDESTPLLVREAGETEMLARGQVLLAPGDFHLRLRRSRRAVLEQGPKRNHVRPAVDVSMETAAENHGQAVIGVVLTGMGSDGTEGARRIKQAGGRVIAEHKSSCVIHGMPRSVTEAGLADRVVPLSRIAATLTEMVG